MQGHLERFLERYSTYFMVSSNGRRQTMVSIRQVEFFTHEMLHDHVIKMLGALILTGDSNNIHVCKNLVHKLSLCSEITCQVITRDNDSKFRAADLLAFLQLYPVYFTIIEKSKAARDDDCRIHVNKKALWLLLTNSDSNYYAENDVDLQSAAVSQRPVLCSSNEADFNDHSSTNNGMEVTRNQFARGDTSKHHQVKLSTSNKTAKFPISINHVHHSSVSRPNATETSLVFANRLHNTRPQVPKETKSMSFQMQLHKLEIGNAANPLGASTDPSRSVLTPLGKSNNAKSTCVTSAAATSTAEASHAVSATTASVNGNETLLANTSPSADSTLVAAAASDQQVTKSTGANSKKKHKNKAKSDFDRSNCHIDTGIFTVVKSERQKKNS